MLHTRILIPHLTVSDPYAPKTEKQIPFHQGFILVMRHGPYLTLTAAFLFITVAIQVKSTFTANGVLHPDKAEDLLALNVDLIKVEELLLKAHGLKHVFKAVWSDSSASHSLLFVTCSLTLRF